MAKDRVYTEEDLMDFAMHIVLNSGVKSGIFTTAHSAVMKWHRDKFGITYFETNEERIQKITNKK